MVMGMDVVDDGGMHPTRSDSGHEQGRAGLVIAAVFGVVHAGFSLYWAVGGSWLIWSLGRSLLRTFEGREWILFPVGIVKLLAAVAPLVLAHWGWPGRSLTRVVCWVGAAILIVWGGLNTIVGNLVLSGVITPTSGFDRPGMIGHAWLWDPLFLAWGVALCLGLLASRRISLRDRASRS